jgi:CHASE2 domain-containing sensor protein
MAGATVSNQSALAGIWHLIRRYLRVTFAVQDGGPATERIRAVTLALIVGLLYATVGTLRYAAVLAQPLVESPFDLDLALRTVSLGWFDSKRTVPVTIVDIDAATHRAWGSPATTPRDDLAQMLQVVSAAQPAAIVVDIDLSWGDGDSGATAADSGALREFLAGYAGAAPLVFPKRIEPAVDGKLRAAVSPYDDLFAGNSRLAWAHANFETDSGGTVRDWHEWRPLCSESGIDWLPSVPVSIAATVAVLPAGLERPTPPVTVGTDCGAAAQQTDGQTRRLLVGPRLTGGVAHRPMADARVVSAATVLDAELARDDQRLFGGRVVFIGASHPSSGDFWLTPVGVISGVEMIANTVRFAPLQAEAPTRLHRAAAVVLFAAFALLGWYCRWLVALFLSAIVALACLVAMINGFDDLRAFDVVEAAIVMMLVYKALEAVLDLVADVRFRPAGTSNVLLAACLRRRPALPGDDDARIDS